MATVLLEWIDIETESIAAGSILIVTSLHITQHTHIHFVYVVCSETRYSTNKKSVVTTRKVEIGKV